MEMNCLGGYARILNDAVKLLQIMTFFKRKFPTFDITYLVYGNFSKDDIIDKLPKYYIVH